MIEWKNKRSGMVGTFTSKSTEYEVAVTKSVGGGYYRAYLGSIWIGNYTTKQESKESVEAYCKGLFK